MLGRQLTEDEDAPYQKLYRLEIPKHANPPISSNPPEDTVQAIYANKGELLVSFDPEVLEWYPSVVIPLPQHELFSYMLNELVEELSDTTDDEVLRVAGTIEDDEQHVWIESSALSQALVAIYATSAERRLTLDIPLPDSQKAQEDIRTWLSQYVERNA
jgi:hypothetical protein